MTYSVDYFLEKFYAIPDEMWLIGNFVDKSNPAIKCALGHCGYHWSKYTEEAQVLREHIFETDLINDGTDSNGINFSELGDTPKERILNALLLVKCGLWKESLGG